MKANYKEEYPEPDLLTLLVFGIGLMMVGTGIFTPKEFPLHLPWFSLTIGRYKWLVLGIGYITVAIWRHRWNRREIKQ